MSKLKFSKISGTELLESYDYDQFVKNIKNRPISIDKVNMFVKEFKEGRNFMKEFPVIIDENNNILDGQHRSAALKITGKPIVFRYATELDISNVVAIQLNAGWKTTDFIHSYINQGINDYLILDKFMKRYGFPASTAARLLSNPTSKGMASGNGLKNSGFYTGGYRVTSESKAHIAARNITEIGDLTQHKLKSDRGFALAIITIMGQPGYDQKRMATQMSKYSAIMKRQVNTNDYIRNLEEVYNYHLTAKNKVRFNY